MCGCFKALRFSISRNTISMSSAPPMSPHLYRSFTILSPWWPIVLLLLYFDQGIPFRSLPPQELSTTRILRSYEWSRINRPVRRIYAHHHAHTAYLTPIVTPLLPRIIVRTCTCQVPNVYHNFAWLIHELTDVWNCAGTDDQGTHSGSSTPVFLWVFPAVSSYRYCRGRTCYCYITFFIAS